MLATAITVAACATVAIPVAGLLARRAIVRSGNAGRLRITGSHGIDEQDFVQIGELAQWLSLRGEDRTNPVVVEVHGGPGSSNSVLAGVSRDWERHVTLVRWDMRGTGKTLRRSGAEGSFGAGAAPERPCAAPAPKARESCRSSSWCETP
ncbi:hypothetical protein OHU25_51025 [Streptomyces sp. NBC_00117]|uniref:hypothetical protein n=1 Tax=Streptomyces sp. NBC_00117 TaxID=2975657 RepID=UPI00324519DD